MFTQLNGEIMINIYDGLPDRFIENLDSLKARDEAGILWPLYAESKERMLASMLKWLRPELERNPVLTTSDCPGDVVDQCLTGDELRRELRELAIKGCQIMHLAPGFYLVPMLNFIIRVAAGRDEVASRYFDTLMIGVVWAYRMRQFPREAGKRGGNPGSRHKEEAMAIAVQYLDKNPGTVRSRLVQIISSELVVKYSDVPHLSSIRRWLRDIY